MIKLLSKVLIIYLILLVLSAFGFSLYEEKIFLDGLWWALVTSTTVGYGDLYPITIQGRIIATMLMLFSTFVIVPLIIGYISSKLIVDNDAFTHEEQELLKSNQKELLEENKQIKRMLGRIIEKQNRF